MHDVVYLRLSAGLPVRLESQPYAHRVELRLGKAYPVALIIDWAMLDEFAELIEAGRRERDTVLGRHDGGSGQGGG